MSDALVLVERQGPVTHIILNRPEVRNALNTAMMTALVAALDAVNEDPDQRVVILRGNGPVFCAGLDLKEAADPAIAHESATLVAESLAKLVGSTAVTICAAQKAAIAGGAGLLMACDLAVVDAGFRTGFPEVHRGLVAGLVMTLLRRQVAERAARELLLLGENIDAETALRLGLVNRIAADGQLEAEAATLAEKALKGAPGAISLTKRMLNRLWPRPLGEDLQFALECHLEARTSPEAQEGMAAFREKRPPNW